MCLLYAEFYLLEATKIAQDTKNFCDYEFVGLHQSSNRKNRRPCNRHKKRDL